MAAFVLVHGGGLGGWAWRAVREPLEAAGHAVYAPSLTGAGDRAHLRRPDLTLALHVEDVVNVLFYEDLTDVVLAGHSYGGMVIAGVADRVPERIRHLVYVDALAPRDGESALDLFPPDRRAELLEDARTRGDGVWVPPPPDGATPRHVPHPLGTLLEPIRLTSPAAATLPRTFVYCARPPSAAIAPSAARARAEGWRWRELACGHAVTRDAPRQLADELLATLGAA